MAVVVVAGAAGIAVSQSRQALLTSAPITDTQSDKNGQTKVAKAKKSGRQMDVSAMYKVFRQRRKAADKSLKRVKRNKKLEKAAQQRAKQYARQGNDFRSDNLSRYYGHDVLSEDTASSKRFILPKINESDLTSKNAKKMGIGCYEKNGKYYWVFVYAR